MIIQKKAPTVGRAPRVARAMKTAISLGLLGATAFIAGCGGGGGGSNNGGNVPNVPPLTPISATTPSDAVNTIASQGTLPVTGVSSTTLDTNITPNEIADIISQFSDPTNVAFAQFGSTSTVISAQDLGITTTELRTFFTQDLNLASIIQTGDQLQELTFDLSGSAGPASIKPAQTNIVRTLAIIKPGGAIRFVPLLSFFPGSAAFPGTDNTNDPQVVSNRDGSTVLSVVTNRSPFVDNYILFQVPQKLVVKFADNKTSATASVQYPSPTLAPGIRIINQSEPVITQTAGTNGQGRTITFVAKTTFTVGFTIANRTLWTRTFTITTTTTVQISSTGGGS